ncbi:MAG: ribonuclease P protein subunit [Thermoplasmata archaeon]
MDDAERRRALAGELIGAPVTIARAPGLRRLPLAGTIRDETLSMFEVERSADGRRLWIPKAGLEGSIVLAGRPLPLSGDALRYRPQDRTKRLLQAGPRRQR